MPFARRSPISATGTGSSARRPTQWRAWAPTCASTRSSTRPTGSSAHSFRKRSSKEVDDDERHCGDKPCGPAVPRQAAARAQGLGGVCDLCRDHGAHRSHGPERRRAGGHRRAGGTALAFLLASIAIALVSYAFIRLTSFFQAGSAYALAGVTLGPRAGFFACWALLGTYSAFLAANFAEIGLFGESFFSGIGVWDNPDWVIISLVAAALIWLFAYNEIKVVTRSLLGFEAISVALVTILIIVIYVKVIGGNAPNGQDFSFKPFIPAEGVGLSAVAFASVFGFLSFGGFEGAAALGEETNNPRRNVPLAIAVAVGFCGIFYTLVMFGQTLGFGIDQAGIDAFSSS